MQDAMPLIPHEIHKLILQTNLEIGRGVLVSGWHLHQDAFIMVWVISDVTRTT